MKADELMVGDFVTFADCLSDDEITVIEITGVDASDEAIGKIDYADCNDTLGLDELAGIPLTEEILKKNGFYFGNTTGEEDFSANVGCGLPEPGWCYDEGGGEVKIIFPNDADGGLIRIDDECADRHMEFVFVNPIMVHELQHVLRLCGIEKEVTL